MLGHGQQGWSRYLALRISVDLVTPLREIVMVEVVVEGDFEEVISGRVTSPWWAREKVGSLLEEELWL